MVRAWVGIRTWAEMEQGLALFPPADWLSVVSFTGDVSVTPRVTWTGRERLVMAEKSGMVRPRSSGRMGNNCHRRITIRCRRGLTGRGLSSFVMPHSPQPRVAEQC